MRIRHVMLALVVGLVVSACVAEPACGCDWPTETNTSPVTLPSVLPVARATEPGPIRVYDVSAMVDDLKVVGDDNFYASITVDPMRGGGAILGPGQYGSFRVDTGFQPGVCQLRFGSLDTFRTPVSVDLYQYEAVLVPGGALYCDDFTNYGVVIGYADASKIAGAPWTYR